MLHALTDRLWKRILWIAALALLAYLPAALQLTYYRDDWYYAYDAIIGPAGVFRYMFASDRPARGPFFELYHALFGIAPTPYHLAMLFWRIAGGAAVALLSELLWPQRRSAGMMAGALFALYPGFTWWVQGIEYQPMVASAALMTASLCLTVLALRVKELWQRMLCIGGAILTGWMYIALVEYAAGMELFRLAIIYVASASSRSMNFQTRAQSALRTWLPYLIIPVAFAIWRFLLFTSERKATDLVAQLSSFAAEPLSTGLHWLMSFLLSFINVTLGAWIQPLQESFFPLRLREQAPALIIAVAACVLVWLLLNRTGSEVATKRADNAKNWQPQALWLGLAATVLGVLPVIAANRQITFPSFSHYALPASLGVAFLVVGLVELLSIRDARTAAFVLLIALSVLTHQGLGASALHEEAAIANFWHQMAWRAPSIAQGTTLIVSYPGVDYGSDSDVVWGPANFIYYTDRQAELPVRLPLSATTLERGSYSSFASAEVVESEYRSHTMTIDYGNTLAVAQASTDTCARVLVATRPLFSAMDNPDLRWLSARSSDRRIIEAGPQVELPALLFGDEPAHGWCYYFQKAALAAQRGDWQEIARLQETATQEGLQPNDQIEWMPFLQAQAYLGDKEAVRNLASLINTEKMYRVSACGILAGMAGDGYALSPQMDAYVGELFCKGIQ